MSGKLVLFPVRLDDAVTTPAPPEPGGELEEQAWGQAWGPPWAANLRRRHIGDFCNWKDHDAFKKAFERLLRESSS